MYSSLLDIIYIQQHDDLTDTHLLYKSGEIDKHTRMYAHMCVTHTQPTTDGKRFSASWLGPTTGWWW